MASFLYAFVILILGLVVGSFANVLIYRVPRGISILRPSSFCPECKKALPINRKGEPQGPQLTDVACPKCGVGMSIRRGRFGPFLSCSTYPDCKGIVKLDRKGIVKPPTAPPLEVDLIPCPNCEGKLNLRRSKRGPWLSCAKYPKCRGRVGWKPLPDEQKAILEKALEDHEKANPVETLLKTDGTPVGDEHKPEISQDDQDAPDAQDKNSQA